MLVRSGYPTNWPLAIWLPRPIEPVMHTWFMGHYSFLKYKINSYSWRFSFSLIFLASNHIKTLQSFSRFLRCSPEYSRYLFLVTPALIGKLRILDLVPLFSYSKVFFCFPSFSLLPKSLHLLILFDFIFSNFDCLNFFFGNLNLWK